MIYLVRQQIFLASGREKKNVLNDSLALEVVQAASLVNFDSGELHAVIPPLAIAFNCL